MGVIPKIVTTIKPTIKPPPAMKKIMKKIMKKTKFTDIPTEELFGQRQGFYELNDEGLEIDLQEFEELIIELTLRGE